MLRILAITDKRYVRSTLEVVGEEGDILVSPPLTASEIQPSWLEGYDVIYIDLHGLPGSAYLYAGENQDLPGLSFKTVRQAWLDGAIVVATSCHLPSTPFVDAFLAGGARAVIAGEDVNFGGRTRASSAQRLAMDVIFFLRAAGADWDVQEILDKAKTRLGREFGSLFRPRITRDALAFKLYQKEA